MACSVWHRLYSPESSTNNSTPLTIGMLLSQTHFSGTWASNLTYSFHFHQLLVPRVHRGCGTVCFQVRIPIACARLGHTFSLSPLSLPSSRRSSGTIISNCASLPPTTIFSRRLFDAISIYATVVSRLPVWPATAVEVSLWTLCVDRISPPPSRAKPHHFLSLTVLLAPSGYSRRSAVH